MSAINQQNKETVWGLWQRLNHAPVDAITGILQTTAHSDIAWHGPHPINEINGVDNLVVETSPSLPSGHTQAAAVYWGLVATWARRRWVWVAVGAYAVLMGLSRLVLGVHYPQDILAALLVSAAWLAIYLLADRPLSAWLGGLPLGAQVALGAGLGLAMVALLPTEDGGTLGGMTLGFGVGLALGERWARFDAGGAGWQRVARYVLGAAVVLGLKSGLGAAFEGLRPELALRVLRYGLIGVWVAFGAPWLFLKMGLARPD